AVFDRIFEYLDLEPEVRDRSGAIVLPTTRGHIRFENVGFAYGTAGNDVALTSTEASFGLPEDNFGMHPGGRRAVVGPSGAGKTTVTYLLPRFFDPTEGRITLDDHDLRELTQESLRVHIGMVTQETFLFHASVRENLLYARPHATEAEMFAAAEAAN